MSLDVYLYRLLDFDTDKVVLYSKKSSKIWISAQRGKNVPLTEQEAVALSLRSQQLALKMGLPFDIDAQIEQKKQEISLPSVKYPNEYRIGYWHSGYGGGGIDTILKATIGRGLYDAFPEAKGYGIYIKPDWQRSHQLLQNMLIRFQSKGSADRRFLKAISFTIGLGESFTVRFDPPTLEGQDFIARFRKGLTPQAMFSGYAKEIEVILESIEYVLIQPDRNQYLLNWDA